MMCLQKLSRAASRSVSVSFLMLLLMVTASAYTVVMRGGRRIEIPSRFVVTPTTLTYEVTPGIQITLQMAAIDIAATERANRETPGSLLKRAELGSALSGPNEDSQNNVVSRGTRTITNRDLEATKKRRRASEVAYETRRRELGLPSVEASRQRDAFEHELIGRELQQTRGAERDTETYWRTRASDLRTEMAVVDAELNYARTRLDETSFSDSGSFTTLDGNGPFIAYGSRQIPGRGYGRGRRGRGGLDPWGFPQARPGVLFPNAGGYGSSSYELTSERSALINRFNELAARRAGLNVRWRELEEEARRAGAPPGWLRP